MRHRQHWERDTESRQSKNTTQKTKVMSNMDHTNLPGVNLGGHEWKVVPASYKTPTMLLI
jgi:hypothetical protein